MDDGTGSDGISPRLSRRSLLGAAVAAGVTLGSETTAASGTEPVDVEDRIAGSDFEEREWGYVRSDFEPPAEGSDTPVVLSMDGYGRFYISGTELRPPTHYVRMRDGVYVALQMEDHGVVQGDGLLPEYKTVYGSIRGTGCSGGRFNLFDRTHARDGYEVIEWLADRPWSLDRVGLLGGSYTGLTVFYIASTQPPSLGAMSASMVVGDLYRGIAYPGGVPNSGFPALWTGGVRPALDVSGTARGAAQNDPICAQNVANREPTNPGDQDTSQMYSRRQFDLMYYSRQLLTYADRVDVPTFIGHAWHDEQTGPRGGPELFRAISPSEASPPGLRGAKHRHEEPKVLRATNGFHNEADVIGAEQARRWFDYWLLGKDTGIMEEPRVELHLNNGTEDHGTVGYDDFPVPSAEWTRYYLDADGELATSPPQEPGTDTYVAGSPRQSWVWAAGEGDPVHEGTAPVTMSDGPDVLTYRTAAFETPRLVAGPMAARLYLETTATDTDLFVSVYDQYPDGSATPIQRGMLRASHRSLDETRSLYTEDGELYRPYHPHTNPQPVTPGEVERYDVEVFPVGHVLYPGHRLVVRVHSPPATDGLWAYEPVDQAGRNTLHMSEEHPSSVLVPLVDASDRDLPPEPECGAPLGHRCVQF